MSSFTCNSKTLDFKVGYATDIGGGRENQDDFFVWENKPVGVIVACILDGHGREVGKIAANAAKASLTAYFNRCSNFAAAAKDILIEAHNIAHFAIKNAFALTLESLGYQVCESDDGYLMKRKTSNEAWMCVHGGTSCTIVLIVGTTVFVANVGDSSAVAYTAKPVLQKQDLQFEIDAANLGRTQIESAGEVVDTDSSCLLISAEHSPESALEFCRLRTFRPSEMDSRYPAIQVIYDVCSHNKRECVPVFNPESLPLKPSGRGNYYKNIRREWASLVATPPSARFQDALAFTRSLGDLHLHTYGITHLPEVHRIQLDTIFPRLHSSDSGVVCIVVASDGVWDNWQYEDVGKFVMDSSCLKAVGADADGAQKVADSFMSRNALFSRKNFGNQADNATCIVLYIIEK